MKKKKHTHTHTWRYHHFTHVSQKLLSDHVQLVPEIWCAMHGWTDGQTDGWMDRQTDKKGDI